VLALGDDEPAPVKPVARTKPLPLPLPPDQRFRSRPDLTPPAMTVETLRAGTAPGLVFLAPNRRSGPGGPAILDEQGNLRLIPPHAEGRRGRRLPRPAQPRQAGAHAVEGRTTNRGYGAGTWVLADRSYREIARVRAGNRLQGDLHHVQLTRGGTALITITLRAAPRWTPSSRKSFHASERGARPPAALLLSA
jgi:hypothetical protein